MPWRQCIYKFIIMYSSTGTIVQSDQGSSQHLPGAGKGPLDENRVEDTKNIGKYPPYWKTNSNIGK